MMTLDMVTQRDWVRPTRVGEEPVRRVRAVVREVHPRPVALVRRTVLLTPDVPPPRVVSPHWIEEEDAERWDGLS